MYSLVNIRRQIAIKPSLAIEHFQDKAFQHHRHHHHCYHQKGKRGALPGSEGPFATLAKYSRDRCETGICFHLAGHRHRHRHLHLFVIIPISS